MKKILDILKIEKRNYFEEWNDRYCEDFLSKDPDEYNSMPGAFNCTENCKYFYKQKEPIIYCDLKK